MYKHKIIEGIDFMLDNYENKMPTPEKKTAVIRLLKDLKKVIKVAFCFSMKCIEGDQHWKKYVENKSIFKEGPMPYPVTLLCLEPNKPGGSRTAILCLEHNIEEGVDKLFWTFVGEPRHRGIMHPIFQTIVPGENSADFRRWIDTTDDEHLKEMDDFVNSKETYDMTRYILMQLYFFLELLECKNIGTITHEAPAKLNKKRIKNNKPPVSEYKTLILKPTGKQQASGELQGLWENKLHWCRGHFKTFTKEKPLFGRHVGKYYWPPRIRGNKNLGMIDKDYRLET